MSMRMNRFERPTPIGTEAQLDYLDADYRVVRHGAFVICAVTREPIPLAELRYWSVALQEAYAGPEAVLIRTKQLTDRQPSKSGV